MTHHRPTPHERRTLILCNSFWHWDRYQGGLVGPIPHVRSPGGCWVPDYSHPGVRERVRTEVDYIEDERRNS